MAGQGLGDLQTVPAAASLGRDQQPQGAVMGSWAVGRVGGAPGGWAGSVRAGGALRALTLSRRGAELLRKKFLVFLLLELMKIIFLLPFHS